MVLGWVLNSAAFALHKGTHLYFFILLILTVRLSVPKFSVSRLLEDLLVWEIKYLFFTFLFSYGEGIF
jgi:hypothetical protein